LKQILFDNLNKFICLLKKNRRYKPKTDKVMANIGSGIIVTEGWINVDATPHALFAGWPKFVLKFLYKTSNVSDPEYHHSFEKYYNVMQKCTFIHHRIDFGLPFPDSSIDVLYSSHMLEHLFKEDSKKFLKETYRVVKKNGSIRICIPDLEYAFKLYQNGETEKALKLFFVPTHFNLLFQHHYMYDFNLLKNYLEDAGFINITRCQYQQGKTPDIDKLDVFPEETLYVEVFKP
jgi:predicted SAM-dependent methyltransferase